MVPGTRTSSTMVPSSARRIAPNSRGYMSRDASRIILRIFRVIPVTRFMDLSLAGQLLLDPAVEVVLEPHELRPPLGAGEDDVLGALEGGLVLAVHHEEALLRLHEAHVDRRLGGEDVRAGRRLERRDGRCDDRIYPRVDNWPARRHRVGGRAGRGRDDHSVRTDPFHDLVVEADLEVADLRDLRGVDDRLVRAVEHPLAIDGDLEPHPLLDL